jgi:hypothetical protein
MSRIPICLDSRLTDGDKVVSPAADRALLPTNIIILLLVLISVTGRAYPRVYAAGRIRQI